MGLDEVCNTVVMAFEQKPSSLNRMIAIGVSRTIGGLTESATYTYDDLGRLATSNQTSNTSSGQRRFAYDRWGNRTGMWDASSGGNQIQFITLQQSGGAPTNRITSVTSGSTLNYTYDAAGNLTNDGLHAYGYDSENRSVSVDGGSTASYAYDNQNRRYKKTIGATVTHYVWEGSQVIDEHNGSTGSVLIDYVYAGGRMIAAVASGSTQYFLSDRLSERLSVDSSGNVLGRQSHLPFGEDFGETGTQQKHHFTSYERDSETSADYALNRQYSANIGRLNRPDPYSGSYIAEAPQTHHRYNYVANDPVNAADPLGLLGCAPYGDLTLYFMNGRIIAAAWSNIHMACSAGSVHDQARGAKEKKLSQIFRTLNGKKRKNFDQALDRAKELANKPQCDHCLASYGIPSLRALLDSYEVGVVDDGAQKVSGNAFVGQDSQAEIDWSDGTKMVHGTIDHYFDTHSNDNAISLGGITYFGPRFFNVESKDERAVTLLHEATHAFAGVHDTQFGKDQDEGSQNLTKLITDACLP